jgi:hypothetical protein
MSIEHNEDAIETCIRVYDDVFNESECQDVIDKFEKLAESMTIINSQHQYEGRRSRRNDHAMMLDDHDTTLSIMVQERLLQPLNQYNEDIPNFDVMKLVSIGVKLQRTPPGGGYHDWHCESANRASMSRKLVWMLYLNDVNEGGATHFLNQCMKVHARRGRVILWPADFPYQHRGEIPISNTKYIATGWYHLDL